MEPASLPCCMNGRCRATAFLKGAELAVGHPARASAFPLLSKPATSAAGHGARLAPARGPAVWHSGHQRGGCDTCKGNQLHTCACNHAMRCHRPPLHAANPPTSPVH